MASPWMCTTRSQCPVPRAHSHWVPSDVLRTALTAGCCTACSGAGSQQAALAGRHRLPSNGSTSLGSRQPRAHSPGLCPGWVND